MTDGELAVQKIIESGVEPLILNYIPVYDVKDSRVIAYRSEVYVNSLELGVLKPDEYQRISDRSKQSIKLSLWNARALTNKIDTMIRTGTMKNCEWISMSVPLKLFEKESFIPDMQEIFTQAAFGDFKRLCLDFPIDILFEDTGRIKEVLTELKSMGIRTALTDYGNSFCPLLRLNGLAFDFVYLDAVLNGKYKDENEVKPILDIVKAQGSTLVACGIKSDVIKNIIEKLEISYYIW